MKDFKSSAYKVLEGAKKPLHSKDITNRAIKAGYLKTTGKTPEATMNALLITDINEKKNKSAFIKTDPSTFNINPKFNKSAIRTALKEKDYPISKTISSKQKGDIGEARIAELIMLYGENLSCYKPISDDEGIDLIIKQRSSFKTFHLQVKTRYGTSSNTSLIAVAKEKCVKKDTALGLVFCFFDTEDGDIWDYIWFVPAIEFIKLAKKSYNKKLGSIYKFIAGRSQKDTNKWAKFLIDKRDLGNKIIKQLETLK
ncbi:hypothetical protein KJ786_00215 [Patescibacteria group bacterium]|nr:hypothetical protein [Patescibacteria group bacterium]